MSYAKKLKAMGHGQALPIRDEPRPSTSASAREAAQGGGNGNFLPPYPPPPQRAPPPQMRGQDYVDLLRLAYTRIRELEGKVENLEKEGSHAQDQLRRYQCFNTQIQQSFEASQNQSNRQQTHELRTFLNLEVFERFATVVEQLLKTDQSLVTANTRLVELKNMVEAGVVQKRQMSDRLNKIVESVEALVAEQNIVADNFKEISSRLNQINVNDGVLNEVKEKSERLLQIAGPDAEKLQGAIANFEDLVQSMNQLRIVAESGVDMIKQVGDKVESNNQTLAQKAKEATELGSKQDTILEELASIQEIVQNRPVPTDNSMNVEASKAAAEADSSDSHPEKIEPLTSDSHSENESQAGAAEAEGEADSSDSRPESDEADSSDSQSENDNQAIKFTRPITRSFAKRKGLSGGSKGNPTLESAASSSLAPPSLSLYLPGSPRPQRRRRLETSSSDEEVESRPQPAPRQRIGGNRVKRNPKRKTRKSVDYRGYF